MDLHAEHFWAGDIDEILPRFSETLTKYLDGSVLQYTGRDQPPKSVAHHLLMLKSKGGISLKPILDRPIQTAGDRHRFKVTWRHKLGNGIPPRHARTSNFASGNEEDWIVQ